jgi:dihydroorotate dehydrogenase (NAD+) catalytic subunit
VVGAVRAATRLPLVTKLSPNVTRIGDFARAVVDAGSDMVSLINTLSGMAIDIETRQPRIANRFGGLSGPAIKPIAVRMVYETAKAVNVPIIGMGGIVTAEDAVEFLMAGASAVAVGTAIFTDPEAPLKVIAGIDAWLDRHGCKAVADIVGTVQA